MGELSTQMKNKNVLFAKLITECIIQTQTVCFQTWILNTGCLVY
jgi:hypothetical protein